MKDSFIFEGKKYISARRASEISDYSSDYIGQLCRAGKIDCRMVGRSWFVTEESLHLHKANVLHDEIYRNRIQNLRGGKKVESALVSVSSPVAPVAVPAASVVTSAPVASVQTPAAPAQISTHAVAPVKAESSPLSYEADSRPLMPVMAKEKSVTMDEIASPYVLRVEKKNDKKVVAPKHVEESDVATHVVPIRSSETYADISRGLILKRALNIALIVVVVTGISMGALIVHGIRSRGLAKGGSASIYDAVTSISLFIESGFNSVLSVFGHSSDLSVNSGTNLPPVSVPTSDSSNSLNSSSNLQTQGIAVAPSSGSDVTDNTLKQQIQQQFSDQVEVHPDQSGTTGVITPVFRDTKGKDFVYVMVPLNSSTQAGAHTSGNSP